MNTTTTRKAVLQSYLDWLPSQPNENAAQLAYIKSKVSTLSAPRWMIWKRFDVYYIKQFCLANWWYSLSPGERFTFTPFVKRKFLKAMQKVEKLDFRRVKV